MKGTLRVLYLDCCFVLLVSFFAVTGCESIALSPRPDVGNRGTERSPGSGVAKEEIIGTVERVDRAKNEIELRPSYEHPASPKPCPECRKGFECDRSNGYNGR